MLQEFFCDADTQPIRLENFFHILMRISKTAAAVFFNKDIFKNRNIFFKSWVAVVVQWFEWLPRELEVMGLISAAAISFFSREPAFLFSSVLAHIKRFFLSPRRCLHLNVMGQKKISLPQL